jgi:hypothetical protein
MPWEDPIVAEVRRTREELSARFGFDLHAIFADLRARQSSAGDRLVRLKGKEEADGAKVAERNAQSVPGR